MGKGWWRRPKQVTREEEDLRWKYAKEKISLKEFDKQLEILRRNEQK